MAFNIPGRLCLYIIKWLLLTSSLLLVSCFLAEKLFLKIFSMHDEIHKLRVWSFHNNLTHKPLWIACFYSLINTSKTRLFINSKVADILNHWFGGPFAHFCESCTSFDPSLSIAPVWVKMDMSAKRPTPPHGRNAGLIACSIALGLLLIPIILLLFSCSLRFWIKKHIA